MVVGLGNPGPRYAETRHNIGFMVVDKLAEQWNIQRWRQVHQAMVARHRFRDSCVLLVKPLTYMNNSGEAVAGLLNSLELPLDRLCVVYDDIHLANATLRIRRKGSDGGHKGMLSLIEHLGSQDFPRVRVGIGFPPEDRIHYVLSPFEESERFAIDEVIATAADAVCVLIEQGVDAAMNLFNRKPDHEALPPENTQSETSDGGSGDPA